MSIDFTNFARASRLLPQGDQEGDETEMRSSRYGDQVVIPLIRKAHALADEGTFFVCNNAGQTGIISSSATGFVATTPTCIIANTDSPSNTAAKRIYVDMVKLTTTVVGSAASGLVRMEGAVYMDLGNRYSSAGSEITANIINPNNDIAKNLSIAKVYFGNLTATAATGFVRALDPYFIFRSTVSGTVADVVGEQKVLNFGAIETTLNGSITVANANNIPIPLAPCIIGPGQSVLIYTWNAVGGTNVAPTFAPQISWWER